MESEIEPWNFQNIFIDIEAKTNFIADVLTSFEQFPPEMKLNCDDFFSLFSLVCEDVPYNFIVFICECVDPSISSGTLNSHRIAFGNFLLALPCCILYPSYIHQILTLFKATDSLKSGVVSKNAFLSIIRNAYTTVGGKGLEKYIEDMKKQKEYEEKHKYDQDFFIKPDPSQIPISLQNDDIKVDLPEMQILDEVENSAIELEEASIQTLFFVLWQKNQYLLQCKTMIRESLNVSEPQSREEYRSQASSDHQEDGQPKGHNTQEEEQSQNNQELEQEPRKVEQEQETEKINQENNETKEIEEGTGKIDQDDTETKDNGENKENNENNENEKDTSDKPKTVTMELPSNLNLGLSLTRKDYSPKLSDSMSPPFDEEELVEADDEYQPRHSML